MITSDDIYNYLSNFYVLKSMSIEWGNDAWMWTVDREWANPEHHFHYLEQINKCLKDGVALACYHIESFYPKFSIGPFHHPAGRTRITIMPKGSKIKREMCGTFDHSDFVVKGKKAYHVKENDVMKTATYVRTEGEVMNIPIRTMGINQTHTEALEDTICWSSGIHNVYFEPQGHFEGALDGHEFFTSWEESDGLL